VGSTYGPEGITIAIRIGFDDNRSLGPGETGGRVALPVFKEIMLKVYREKLTGSVPKFPARMEQSISVYLEGDLPDGEDLLRLGISAIKEFDPVQGRSSHAKGEWLQGLLLPQIADLSEKSICCAPRR
jgi:membrane carboxypeptidase/penicillin-binding protein